MSYINNKEKIEVNMKISVCMAVYNGDKYVKMQLDSILTQLGPQDEVIISDDNSTDKTFETISNYKDNRIFIFKNKNEKGYSKNFENAISKSTGDIIFIADQDDVWMDNKVSRMLKSLENNSLVIHDATIVDDNLELVSKSHFKLFNVKTGFLNNFLKTRYIGACMAFKREILQKAFPFPENQKLCAYDYWLTIIAEYYYKVELVQEPLIKYRRHLGNASTGGKKSNNSLIKKISMRAYCLFQLLKR